MTYAGRACHPITRLPFRDALHLSRYCKNKDQTIQCIQGEAHCANVEFAIAEDVKL